MGMNDCKAVTERHEQFRRWVMYQISALTDLKVHCQAMHNRQFGVDDKNQATEFMSQTKLLARMKK